MMKNVFILEVGGCEGSRTQSQRSRVRQQVDAVAYELLVIGVGGENGRVFGGDLGWEKRLESWGLIEKGGRRRGV